MVHVGKLFPKNYGLCGKIFKKGKLQRICGILPQTNSGALQIDQSIYHYEVL